MCRLIAATSSKSNVVPFLLEGLERMEYGGYDSAGIAIRNGSLHRIRRIGKVKELVLAVPEDWTAPLGIGHTRWATHGEPSERNAHPHVSGKVVLVHNGTIENYAYLRQELAGEGYVVTSDTDTEVIAHLVNKGKNRGKSLFDAVTWATARLQGGFALAVIHEDEPETLILARRDMPLYVGFADGEVFASSDTIGFPASVKEFLSLEDGDVAKAAPEGITIVDVNGKVQIRERKVREPGEIPGKDGYRYYMKKEIDDQVKAISETLKQFPDDREIARHYREKRRLEIIACGTSYHAGYIGAKLIQRLARIPATVSVASEWRYSDPILNSDTAYFFVSQSGTTADTFAALRLAQSGGVHVTAICNVKESDIVREADFSLMTHAGREIGVASTKAFTTQLAVFARLTVALGRVQGTLSEKDEHQALSDLDATSENIQKALLLEDKVVEWARMIAGTKDAFFLGRQEMSGVALEGALKLKEIAYVHAEGYPAGELKHGPLALIEEGTPVIVSIKDDDVLPKVVSNMEEAAARGARLFVIADESIPNNQLEKAFSVIRVPMAGFTTPIVHIVIHQLLAYHVAVLLDLNPDMPRNLAKSVTVE